MSIKGFISKSISGWEDSLWGGFSKVLWDYPEIQLDRNFEFEIESQDLGYYRYNKLIKMFLLLSKEDKLSSMYVKDMKTEKVKDFFGETSTRYYLNQGAMEMGLNKLCSADHELTNMLVHYSEVIKNTSIYYDIPDKQKGEGDGDEEDKDGKDDKKDGKSAEQKIGKALGKVVKQEYVPSRHGFHFSGDRDIPKAVFRLIKDEGTCKYSKTEIFNASQLVNLLDISFENKEDRVQSLKSGKLDVNKLAEVTSGNFNIYYRIQEDISTRPFSVCVLLDESGSMEGSNIKAGISLMKTLYLAFSQILPQDKMFFYGHTSDGYKRPDDPENDTPEIRVYHDPYNQTFESSICSAGQNLYENYDGPVIEEVYNKVRSFTSDNIIFIVLSDGQPGGQGYGGQPAIDDMKRIIEKCKRDGFCTAGIGIMYPGVKGIYPYNTVINDLKEFVKKTSMIINRMVKTEFQS